LDRQSWLQTSKTLYVTLNNILQTSNAFNVQNTNTPAHSLTLIKINEDTRLCSSDIGNMYTNIPIHQVQNVVESIMNKNHDISQEMKV
jgi:hypothetical protein